MIKDTDDKKIIFDKNKKFNTKNYEIRNNINNREIRLNDEPIIHACITDITFEDDKITINFLSKDDLEFTYEISKEAETGEIPEYLQINEEDVVLLALKIYTLEAYKVFMSDTTLPEATAINKLQAQITTLTNENETLSGQIETLTGQVETLTGQLEEAQSQTNNTGVQDYQKFTLNNTEYNIRILGNDTSRVFFMFYTDDTPVTLQLSTLGFSSQQGAALFKNTTDNTSIQFELYIDGTLQNNAGGVSTGMSVQYLTTSPAVAFTADKAVCVKVMIKDSSDEVVSTAYDQFTYTTGGGGVVDNRDTTTMQLMTTNLNGYIQIKCMVQNSTRPISGTIVLYAGNTYLDTVTLDNNNYVDYTPELESGTYTFTGYYYGSNEYKPCTNTLSNVEIT